MDALLVVDWWWRLETRREWSTSLSLPPVSLRLAPSLNRGGYIYSESRDRNCKPPWFSGSLSRHRDSGFACGGSRGRTAHSSTTRKGTTRITPTHPHFPDIVSLFSTRWRLPVQSGRWGWAYIRAPPHEPQPTELTISGFRNPAILESSGMRPIFRPRQEHGTRVHIIF